MSKPVVYIAHPVSGDVKANLANVEAWIRALLEHDPSRVYIAPWHGEVAAFLDGFPPGGYDRVLADDQEVVAVCAGLMGVGGTWSPGMRLEGNVAADVWDWTQYRHPAEVTEDEWFALRNSNFAHNPFTLEDAIPF